MSRLEKEIERLKSEPKDYTYYEAKSILKAYQINEILRVLKEGGLL